MKNEKQYISDIIGKRGITKKHLFNDGYYSIIAGGVGTGKSTFTCKGLAKILNCKSSEILLVAPLVAIEQQLINKGKADKQDLTQTFFKVDNVPVCTYAALMNNIKAKNLSPQIKYFVFDEAHQLITAENYAKYGAFFFKWLDDNGIHALFLTATPMALLTYKHGKKTFKEVLVVKSNVKVGNVIFTTEIDLLSHVKYFARNKMFIAVQTVTDAQKLEKQLNDRVPGSAKAIFSKTHDKATDEMRTVADEIIKTEQFPEEVHFLIVTGAYIEGMEIQTECESALIKQPSVTAIVQAIGRLRQGVKDVVVVLSKDPFFAKDQNIFNEFQKFLTAYRKEKDEVKKFQMLLGIYAVQEKQYGREFVNIHGMEGYIADYQINMPLYHSLETRLYDAKRLYCGENEISNEQFEKLEAMFLPYFPEANFMMLNREGLVRREEKYEHEIIAFLTDLNGRRIFKETNSNGITLDEVCRRVMQLKENNRLYAKKPIKDIRTLKTEIQKYGFTLGKRNSTTENGEKVTFYPMIRTHEQQK